MYSDSKLCSETEIQIVKCLDLAKKVLGQDLLGIYLYGSSIVGGLQKYSDIDLFVVSNRSTTHEEKAELVSELLKISGIYMKSTKKPIEITIVERSSINPWRYPPRFDFQYGEWLRQEFEQAKLEPWTTKEMPDLALLVTQILLASKPLVGPSPDQLLCKVPYKDFMAATFDSLPILLNELESDTRNVLLTLSRIWSTAATDTIRSKTDAAEWAINRLPELYRPVMERAKAICIGKEKEKWNDIRYLIKPCADLIANKIHAIIIEIMKSDHNNRSIKLHLPRA